MLEFIAEIFIEVFLQFLFEVLAECGLHAFKRKPLKNPALAASGYLIFGGILGGLSLLVLPSSFIAFPLGRIANLIISPLLVGLAMAWIGRWRSKRGNESIRLERFWYGALFALGLALVRFIWAA